jgi:hypothetical protein
MYERPLSLTDVLLGIKAPEPAMRLDASKMADLATPRVWYLAPQSDLAGLMSTLGRE